MAITLAVVLVLAGLAGALTQGIEIAGLVLAYGVGTTLYSYVLKTEVILDVMTIAGLFVLRVLAGAVAVDADASAYLLLCTGMVAMFLGFTKRRQEASSELHSGTKTRPVLEHYSIPFLDQMVALVTASTVMSYAIYAINSPLIGSKMLGTLPAGRLRDLPIPLPRLRPQGHPLDRVDPDQRLRDDRRLRGLGRLGRRPAGDLQVSPRLALAAAAAALIATATVAAGCSVDEAPNDSEGDPPAYDVAFPPGFKSASPDRVAQLEESVQSGIDSVEGEVGEVQVEDFQLGVIEGSPVEIDIQSEDTGDGVDVNEYDEASRETLSAFPGLDIGETSEYAEFDGDESTVVDITEGPNGPTSRIATAVHGGFAFNLTLYGPTDVVTGPGDEALRTMVESWRWVD